MRNYFNAGASALALMTAVVIAKTLAGAEIDITRSDKQSADAVAVATRFNDALSRGDSTTAARLLSSDAIVLESGERETRKQYLAGHLGEDIEFARSVVVTRTLADVHRQGDVVWVTTTSVAKGRFRDRDINSRGAELMVLSRAGPRWMIRAIHWSSRRAGR